MSSSSRAHVIGPKDLVIFSFPRLLEPGEGPKLKAEAIEKMPLLSGRLLVTDATVIILRGED